MAPEAQLEWEARAGRPVAIAAFFAAILPLAGQLVATPQEDQRDGRETADALLAIDEHSGQVLAGTLISLAGFLLLPLVFYYLYRAIKLRRPEYPVVALILGLVGPALYAVLTIFGVLDRIDIAERFAEEEPGIQGGTDPIEERAEDLLDDRSSVITGISLAGALMTAIAFVLAGLYAMRAGLMSRFMGTIGIIVGALYVFPLLGGPQVIQLFWLAALGFLVLDRWPGGRGPAWESGEADPWPTAVDQREAAERARAGGEEIETRRRLPRSGPSDEPEPLEADEPESGDPDTPQKEPHPRSKKRSRKRRR